MGERSDSPGVGWVLAGTVAIAVAVGLTYWVTDDPGPMSVPSTFQAAAPDQPPTADPAGVADAMQRVDTALSVVSGNLLRETGVLNRGDTQGYGVATEKGGTYIVEALCVAGGPSLASIGLSYDLGGDKVMWSDLACDGSVHASLITADGKTTIGMHTDADQPVTFAIRILQG
jgi:hypothetical protein